MPTIEADLSLTHSDAGLLFLLISFGYFIGILGDAGAFKVGIIMVGVLILLTSILPRYLIFTRH
jgi:hypothetical protein